MQPHGMAPIPTHYGRMVAYKNKIYLFGGFDGFQNTTSVYAYNTGSFLLRPRDMHLFSRYRRQRRIRGSK